MPITITIPDNKLTGFNQQAQVELTNGISNFADELIAEANRIEATRSSTSNGPEITSSIVKDAQVIIKHTINKPKKHWGKILIKVLSSLFSLVSGIMYQKENLQNSVYLVSYIFIIALAILFTTLTIIQED